jgi:hypothetical protein
VNAPDPAGNPAVDVRGSVQVAATAVTIAMTMFSLSQNQRYKIVRISVRKEFGLRRHVSQTVGGGGNLKRIYLNIT